jgi:two-component system sensor histidine kinase VanS
MKKRLNIFAKLFIILLFAIVSVYGIQYFARSIFFEDSYIKVVHNNNQEVVLSIKTKLNEGQDLSSIVDDLRSPTNIIQITQNVNTGNFSPVLLENDIYFIAMTTQEFEGTQILVYYTELDNGQFLVYEDRLFEIEYANEAQNIIDTYVIILVAVLFIPLIYFFSKRFTSPLLRMNQQLKALSELNFLPDLNIKTNDELEEVAKSINIVSHNLKEAIDSLHDDIKFEQEKDKKRRQLIATLSHELKTPIATMRAVIEGMKDQVGRYKDRDKYLGETLEYLRYMEQLSKDLIQAIDIESRSIQKEATSINSVFEQANKMVSTYTKRKHQNLIFNTQDCIVPIHKDMMTQVLINLIQNGSKYSPKNADIIVSNTIDEQYVNIRIENTQAQIDDSELDKLFEPFYRVEQSRNKKTGGSGLGLFIVKTILDAHEATYSIYNTSNSVVFDISLKLT